MHTYTRKNYVHTYKKTYIQTFKNIPTHILCTCALTLVIACMHIVTYIYRCTYAHVYMYITYLY